MQVWPVAAKTPATTPLAAASQVGVREDDLRGLAAQLQRHPVDVRRGGLRHRAPVAVEPVNATLSTP